MSSFHTISHLGTTASFYDWFNSYNGSTGAVAKLNKIFISKPYAGDGITLEYNSTSGGYTFALSGTVTKNMAFNGNVVFNGTTEFANAQFSGLGIGISGNYISSGVTLGAVVRVTDTGGLTLAQANSSANAEVLGIAISVDTTKTVVAVGGKVSGTTLSNNLITGGFSTGCVYFLSASVPGGITRTEPTSFGQVSKPIIVALSNTEAAILPYRGQFINGISGSSGELAFNSTLYVTVKSLGEGETAFGLRPGRIIATDIGRLDTSYYEGLGDNIYYTATNTVDTSKMLGIVTSYVGAYSATAGDNIVLKVNTNGSVITDIASLNNWGSLNPGIVYLGSTGLPTSIQETPSVLLGNISYTDLVFDISAPNQTIYTSLGSGQGGSSKNILINGSLSLWQRGRGVTTNYGISAGTSPVKQYLADKWIMWGNTLENGFTGMRNSFSNTQIDVIGYPKHYVSLRKNNTTAGTPAYFYNVLDDVRTLANKQFTFSFYARTPSGTGSFRIHSIQNIDDGVSNQYVNGTTYATYTTPNSNWNRYFATFVGPSANSGITNSYSLIGVGLNDNGKTFDFAQFRLEEGATATSPEIVNIDEEYLRMAPYYQRSYGAEDITGTSYQSDPTTINLKNAVFSKSSQYFRDNVHFPVKMKKAPSIQIYTIDGLSGDYTILINGNEYVNGKNSTGRAGFAGCSRFYTPAMGNTIEVSSSNENSFAVAYKYSWCSFDYIFFHYIADAETTIN
jgi:hypothetical protein